jgi:hypothetical protein
MINSYSNYLGSKRCCSVENNNVGPQGPQGKGGPIGPAGFNRSRTLVLRCSRE